MIVGGREAAKVVDRLKASKVPVVLRLTVPEEPRVPTEQEYRKKAAAERDEPLRVLAQRKTKWKEQLATASVLAREGIPFAFATDGVDRLETIPANLRQVITAGLKADDALAALTKNAAAIAGVDRRLGTLEAGKLGHVIVMTGAVQRGASQGQVCPDRRPEVRDQARGHGQGQRGAGRNRPGSGRAAEKSNPDEEPDEPAPASKKEEARPPAERKELKGRAGTAIEAQASPDGDPRKRTGGRESAKEARRRSAT